MRKILQTTTVWAALPVLVLSLFIFSCKEEKLVVSTTDAVNMTSYLDQHPEQFSQLSEILKLSETSSFLNAYGSYTFFAPTNDAITEYLKGKGKSNVQDISAEDWKNVIRFHLLEDSLSTSQFSDGKLSKPTMYGQYITTGASFSGGFTKYTVNKQANIEVPNVSVGNGIVHVIDHVLTPADKTLAQLIEANPRYTIFTEALKKTGLYDSLNYVPTQNPVEAKKWLTVIAESDSAINAAGFANYNALKLKYSNTGDPLKPADSLHLWMDYHILYDAKYLADIISTNAHNTLAPQEVLTSKLSGQSVLINDDEFNGVPEPGFNLIRALSDVTAKNGVYHEAAAHFAIKVRTAYPVYYDVADMPDLKKMTAYYGKADYLFTDYALTQGLSDIKFESSTKDFIYRYGTSAGTSKNSYNRDILVVPMGTSSRPKWAEFRTPLVVKGKYKIWIGYYRQVQGTNTTTEVQTTIRKDGSDSLIELANSRTLSFTTKRPGLAADVEEAIGWKTYMEATDGSQVARLVGVADIKETGRYWVRLTAINGTQTTNNVDMIQFIPINMDQQYPKFKPDGTLIQRP